MSKDYQDSLSNVIASGLLLAVGVITVSMLSIGIINKTAQINAQQDFLAKVEIASAKVDSGELTAEGFASDVSFDFSSIQPASGAADTTGMIDLFEGEEDPFPTIEVIDDQSLQ